MALSVERLALTQDQLTDINGRHIGSSLSVGQHLPSYIPGREHTATNIKGLQEFQRQRENVFGLISFLRVGYDQPQLTLGKLYNLSCSIGTLPSYMALRRANPVDLNHLPPSTIDASRSIAGILVVSLQMQGAGFPEDKFVDEDHFYNFATGNNPEGKNYFIRSSGDISCPAPEEMVKPFLHAMLYHQTSSRTDLTSADWFGLIQEDEVPKILEFGPDYTAFRTFYRRYQEIIFGGDPNEKSMLREYLEVLYPRISSTLGYE